VTDTAFEAVKYPRILMAIFIVYITMISSLNI